MTIVGTVCEKCVTAVKASRPGLDLPQAFEVALDEKQTMPVHDCDMLIQDPMGGFWGCSCVHHSQTKGVY